jgi:hypothetical protein
MPMRIGMRQGCVSLVAALAALCLLPGFAAAAGGRGDRTAAEHALKRVQDLSKGLGVRTGRELTPAIAELVARRGALDANGRRQADALLARPTSTEAAPGHAYTVTEHAPVCGVHFCIHYVTTTLDAPDQNDSDADGTPDYVELMEQVFESEVFPCENGSAVMGCANAGSTGLGWPQAPSDGALGGDARFDVYIEDLFPSGVFGYVSPDPQPAGSSLHSYLVLDKDFSRYSPTLTGPDEMRVTAAHEYNHVLQFGIDAFEDTWMFEATAVYFEDKVYPGIDDYLSYMPSWVNSTADPLTDANGGGGLKMYGSAVWNHFIAGRHGAPTILAAWQASTQVNGGPFAPASYSTALAANGGTNFSDEFDDFAAAVAEWRAPGSGFPDLYPDVPAAARPSLAVGAGAATIQLDHTTFAFRNIQPPASSTALTLSATLPAGLKGAIALVGRTGASTTGGTVTTQIQGLSNGGAATVSLPNANTYGRITAVLVNADPTQSGWNNGQNDWNFTKDNQNFSGVQVTQGAPPPTPTATSGSASSIGLTSASLNGSVNPNGQATTYWFEYGTTTAYGTQVPLTPASAGSGVAAVAQSAAVSGLTRGTTYHYRIVAQSSGGTTPGLDQTFTTLDPPTATTTAATGVATDGATLNATVDPRGRATTYVFQYGPTAAYGSQLPLAPSSAGSGSSPVAVSALLSGLARAATVHYRVVATNADGTTAGGDQAFRTLDPPVVMTGGAGGIGATGATVTGTVDARGTQTVFAFEYGTTTAYGGQASGDAGSATGALSVAAAIAGLTPGTVYHYRLLAANADGSGAGSDLTFTTAGTGTSSTPTPTPSDGTGTGTNTTTARTSLILTAVIGRVRLGAALSRGLRVRVGCGEPCSIRVRLLLPAKVAKAMRLKRTVATASTRAGTASSLLALRFTTKARRALARLRTVRLTVAVTATASDGRHTSLNRAVALRR